MKICGYVYKKKRALGIAFGLLLIVLAFTSVVAAAGTNITITYNKSGAGSYAKSHYNVAPFELCGAFVSRSMFSGERIAENRVGSLDTTVDNKLDGTTPVAYEVLPWWIRDNGSASNTWTSPLYLRSFLLRIGAVEDTTPTSAEIKVGDILIYDWNEYNGKYKGTYDHVGICGGFDGSGQPIVYAQNPSEAKVWNTFKGPDGKLAKAIFLFKMPSSFTRNTETLDPMIWP